MTAAAELHRRGLLGDGITVARARGRRLAKVIRADGAIAGYDSARSFDLTERTVDRLDSLARLLSQLADRRDCCVVRGGIADAHRTRGVRRLLHPDPDTGDLPTLCDVPRCWAALDIDGLARPDGVATSDLAGCAAVVIKELPAAFRAAGYIAQATGSHGIRSGVRMRLWYWLDRPTSGAELRRWLRGAPVDHSVFGAAQPIYTATPLFCAGAIDPLPQRTMVMRGVRGTVSVPAASTLALPPRAAPAAVTANAAGATRYGFAALTRATARVARAADGGRHTTLLVEARGLAGLVASKLLPEGTVAEALAGAAEMAGLPTAEAASIIAWALAHPRRAL
jgi:hypothetical protein